MAASVQVEETNSYVLSEDVNEAFVLVVCDTAAGTARLPAAEADKLLQLGVIQATGKSGKAVLVARTGTSYLVAGGVIARGAKLEPAIAGNKGRGLSLSAPAKPAAAADPPTKANVDAVNDYAEAIAVYAQKQGIVAEQAAAAAGDIIVVRLSL